MFPIGRHLRVTCASYWPPLARHVSPLWCRWHINSEKERMFLTHLTLLTIGWLRSVGSIKLLVSFAKEPYKRDHILQKRPMILSILLTVATPYRKRLQSWFSRNISPQIFFQATTFESRVWPMMLMARGWRRALTIELQSSDSIYYRNCLYIDFTVENLLNSSNYIDISDFRELLFGIFTSAHNFRVTCLACDADGTWMATGSWSIAL